ncbi:MAG: hypothetical protein HC897_16960 [Thermoanaerobaculia bacterium]|nr:hypothetical protein [Thermoanaerobaculia bacterium]
MLPSERWRIHDRYGNAIYLTDERWEHIVAHHPEMGGCEALLEETLRSAPRKQDSLNPRKYRYVKAFENLALDNTHLVAIVLFRFRDNGTDLPIPNNYVVTAFLKEVG